MQDHIIYWIENPEMMNYSNNEVNKNMQDHIICWIENPEMIKLL